ncbi:peptidoglycan-binding domain-containing protein [Streptomyces sp. MB09-01]|uniref:peptidoglycan-binding domain-containing protein n=1 Tax=Streptomyces sp. MB09-01 TaxID=3028666 RepID=UPI0029AD62B0|nr:peptidoglycan-binding domain-containing protein [Streptomyces sp. MB09-01]MDX3534448.1 peptidoglycan-binding domain-containing protein [Streptomyces sp. MB09-01]
MVSQKVPAPAGLSRRRRWIGAVAGGAVLLTAVGVGSSFVIKSPAQAAAEAGPPPVDVLTSRVEKRVLRDTLIVRGTASAAQTVQVAPSGGGEGAAAAVVTKLPLAQGSEAGAGRVLMEISGRPLFVLPGKTPVYRDLKPGATGDDVAQLQRALAAMGHGSGGDKAGQFGAGTKAALTAFYASIGYDPLPASTDGGQAVTGAQDSVSGAERALQDARAAAKAEVPGGGATGATGAPGASAAPSGKPASSGSDPQLAVTRAQEDLDKARRRLSEAQAKAGPMLPAGEVVFLDGLPARVDALNVAVGSNVSGTAMTLSAGELVVRAQLKEHQKGLVRAGQKVEIQSEVSRITAAAQVQSVDDKLSVPKAAAPAGGSGQGPGQGQGQAQGPAGQPGYALVIRPDQPLDPSLVGQDVRLTIEAAATDGAALVVPVSAVSAGADGLTSVTVVDASGAQRRVGVKAGTVGDGFVEVVPSAPGTLNEGDSVVTGVKQTPGARGGTAGRP